MSKRRYHRRSKMKRRGVKNGSQNGSKNGSKMAPTWLQNGSLEASGQPLGPDPASRPSPEPSRRGSGTARGVPKNSSWRPWNALGAKRGAISASWRVPGRVPEGVWEVIWGAFWRLGRRERKKKQNSHKKVCFFGAVFACVFLPLPCVFCSPRHSPARKHNLNICLKPLVFTI